MKKTHKKSKKKKELIIFICINLSSNLFHLMNPSKLPIRQAY